MVDARTAACERKLHTRAGEAEPEDLRRDRDRGLAERAAALTRWVDSYNASHLPAAQRTPAKQDHVRDAPHKGLLNGVEVQLKTSSPLSKDGDQQQGIGLASEPTTEVLRPLGRSGDRS
jgi:hypothetical protein